MDPRIKETAKLLIEYSTKTKAGDNVIIYGNYESKELCLELYKQALLKGAFPKIHCSIPGAAYTFYKYANEDQLNHFPEVDWFEIQRADVTLFIGAPYNTRELSSIDAERIATRRKVTKKITDHRVNYTRWCIFDFPCNSLAQEADISLDELQDFIYSATLLDWKKQSEMQDKLKKVLDEGKTVRIVGEDTDITLNIEGRTGIKADGKHNMPDGEVFLGPVETKTEGYISYSFPSIYGGREVDGIKLWFREGKVIKATATKGEDFLNKMIKMDSGSMMLGELGIGTNYRLDKHTKIILFDEKMGGTVHLALGSAYKEGGGTNESALHWDMIKDLRKGGEIYVDGKLIQKNGKFLIDGVDFEEV